MRASDGRRSRSGSRSSSPGAAARSRDRRQPCSGTDVRQLLVRLGLADRDRAHGTRRRLLGGRRDRRPVADAVSARRHAHGRRRARRTRPGHGRTRPRVDRDVGSRAPARPAACGWILFGPASVVLASASPIAVRLAARSLERLGRTAGRLFSVSTAGSIAGTFATAFWLVPELGTDQVLAVGATRPGGRAHGRRHRRLRPVPCFAAAIAGALALTLALAPERGGQLSGVAARNWSPLYRRTRPHPGPLDPAAIDSSWQLHRARGAGDPISPPRRRR